MDEELRNGGLSESPDIDIDGVSEEGSSVNADEAAEIPFVQSTETQKNVIPETPGTADIPDMPVSEAVTAASVAEVPATDASAAQAAPTPEVPATAAETALPEATPETEPALPETTPETEPAPLPTGRRPKKTTIGGQALIEGIMMCGPRRTAIAVRKADGSIYVEEIKKSASETFFEKVPLVRGCIRFFRQLVTGTAALMKSAEISEEGAPQEGISRVSAGTDEDDSKPKTIQDAKAEQHTSGKERSASKLDQWAEKHNDGVMIFAAVLGLMFSIVLFLLLPRLIVDTGLHFFSAERSDSIALNVALNFLEGVIRIVIFLTYLGLTSRLKDIARVWMYHGAEHKTIACYEAGEDLTVANVRKMSRFHPRCGTAFLFIVVIVSILVFCVASVFIGVNVWWINMLVRLALVPLVGGISYEILRFCGRHDQNPICKIFIAPGLGLQKLTTKEPTDSMIEVAIASVQAVIPENGNEDIW